MFEKMAVRVLGGYCKKRSNLCAENKNRKIHAISLRLDGEAAYEYDGQITLVKKGDIMYIPAYADYKITCKYDHILIIHFESYYSSPEKIMVCSPGNTSHYEELMRQILSLTVKAQPDAILLATSKLYQLLSFVEQEWESGNRALSEGIRLAIDYLHNHYTDPTLTLPVLTNIASVSDTYFRQKFASLYHTTPIRYINQLRVDYAYNLLLSGMYTVEEVSEASGFTDTKYFSRIFKKYTGHTPAAIKARRFIG